ncbi:MAG: replication-associated recombination protein A [Burkholderiales bacterium]|jgi:putative ATPase|nr:replication-associated recombination protein A [Burkholderiales bacterium]
MDDLFPVSPIHSSEPVNAPLAERLRPKTLAEVIGQRHLIGEGKPLSISFKLGKPHSMILWGPPGVGKTTLARLMADAFHSEFIAISAVLSGIKEIRDAVILAQNAQKIGRGTVLFVDEVHRFNKAQQDAFLPHVESGLFTFVGATTENPSFEVVGALLSRSTVYVLHPLSDEEQNQLLTRALAIALPDRPLPDAIRQLLIGYADGDGRRLVTLTEHLAEAIMAQPDQSEPDLAFVESALARSLRRFDKGGEAFYDQISALHKSVRGSNPDAALYWFCRMLDGGADPLYLARRIVRMAWEDIGLADPRAATLVNEAAQTYERLGSPEGELALATAVIYLAVAPKSNACYTAFSAARKFIREDKSREVPMHLRNAPTKLMKSLGYSDGYRYAHDEPDAYAAGETYLPEGIKNPAWYRPTPRGLEAKIAEKMADLKRRDRDALAAQKK